jgi:hypothetical protein
MKAPVETLIKGAKKGIAAGHTVKVKIGLEWHWPVTSISADGLIISFDTAARKGAAAEEVGCLADELRAVAVVVP